jgi:hypothetical protein
LQCCFEDLDRVLRPLWLNPDERHQDLFEVQELTRVLGASHLYGLKAQSEYAQETASNPSPILDYSRTLVRTTLDHVLMLLDQHPNFETKVTPPSPYWEHFLAFIKHGPPRFNTYFYLYGLFDCASQLARVVPLDVVGENLVSKMRLIIQNSKEPSYRWKAVSLTLRAAFPSYVFEVCVR